MSAIKVGLIGGGAVGAVHLEAYTINKDVQFVALADSDDSAREQLASRFGISKTFSDHKQLLEDESINLVDICLPHHLHCQVALDSFTAGKDVILEKPIALSLEEADMMIKTAEESKRRFFVALNQRFLPCHQSAKELLDNGEIGKPFLVLGTVIGDEFLRMNNAADWKGVWDKAGGGVLADTGTHLIDIMHYFFGEPVSVAAFAKRLVVTPENKGDDNALVALEFSNNVLANLTLTFSATSDNWSEKKDIYGTEGSLHITNEAERPLFVIKNKSVPEYIEVKGGGDNWWGYSIKKGITHFIDCIINETDPLVTPSDARKALETILLCYQSTSEEGSMKRLTIR